MCMCVIDISIYTLSVIEQRGTVLTIKCLGIGTVLGQYWDRIGTRVYLFCLFDIYTDRVSPGRGGCFKFVTLPGRFQFVYLSVYPSISLSISMLYVCPYVYHGLSVCQYT